MPTPTSARRNYRISALIASRAVRQALEARPRGTSAVAQVVIAHQTAQSVTSQQSVVEMLAEQDIASKAAALLDAAAFTTAVDDMVAMIEQAETDVAFERLVDSIVQDAGRATESVAVTVRPGIRHVRYVNPPCCARCAILSGRVYRWSTGFQRHPGCDCTMVPTTVAGLDRKTPDELVAAGLVRGLSKADQRALSDGADLGQVVNVRSRKAGLLDSGQALRRGNRLTPAGIYSLAGNDQAKAIALLEANGYVRT